VQRQSSRHNLAWEFQSGKLTGDFCQLVSLAKSVKSGFQTGPILPIRLSTRYKLSV